MSGVKVDAAQVLANLHKLSADMQSPKMGQALLSGAQRAEGFAKLNVRQYNESEGKLIKTGNMLNSIQTQVDGKEAVLYVGAEYGIYHEMGTVRIPARPYLLRGVTEHLGEVAKAAVAALAKALGL